MQLNRLDLNLLVALDALLREKNVTRAGERIFLSQSAMSGALQRLRDYFGDDLLVRAGRELELTPRAEALAGPIRDILLRIQAAVETEATFDPSTAKRVFSIVMSDYCFVAFMREVVPRLQREAPGITCRIEPVDYSNVKRLDSGEVNFCLLPDNAAPMTEANTSVSLRRTPLFTDDWVCAVWREHPSVGDSLSMEQYLALPHAFTDFGFGTSTVEDMIIKKDGLTIRIPLTYGGFSSLPFVLPGTSMIATIQRRLARVLETSLPIKTLASPVSLPPIQETLYWHERHDFEPGHVWLRNLFIDIARQF
jgi:LysR family transcriptional regulator, nod-box dependent transcriptional activator